MLVSATAPMTPAAIWAAHCRHMALQCRAWGMDAQAAMWVLAADAWRALDEVMERMKK